MYEAIEHQIKFIRDAVAAAETPSQLRVAANLFILLRPLWLACEDAAAPDLLAALSTLREDLRMLRDGEWEPDGRSCDASIDLADAAIAKALEAHCCWVSRLHKTVDRIHVDISIRCNAVVTDVPIVAQIRASLLT